MTFAIDMSGRFADCMLTIMLFVIRKTIFHCSWTISCDTYVKRHGRETSNETRPRNQVWTLRLWQCQGICTGARCSSIFVSINSLRPRQNDRHIRKRHFKMQFHQWKFCISIRVSLTFVPRFPIENRPTYACDAMGRWVNLYVHGTWESFIFVQRGLVVLYKNCVNDSHCFGFAIIVHFYCGAVNSHIRNHFLFSLVYQLSFSMINSPILGCFSPSVFVLNNVLTLGIWHSAISHLPGCFCPWTFFQNIGFNKVPSDPFMSHLAT